MGRVVPLPSPPSTLPGHYFPKAGLWYPQCLAGQGTEQCQGSEWNKLRNKHMGKQELWPLERN